MRERKVFFMIKTKTSSKITLFGSVKVLVACAMFIAMSIVLGKFLSIKIGDNIRISFENLSLILAGILYGPLIGMFTAVTADVLGCFIYGYSINPVITLGAACIGFIAGLLPMFVFKKHLLPKIAVSVFAAHIVGSMIVKSIGLYIYYPSQRPLLYWRIPVYLLTAVAETALIYSLLKSKAFISQFERVKKKND